MTPRTRRQVTERNKRFSMDWPCSRIGGGRARKPGRPTGGIGITASSTTTRRGPGCSGSSKVIRDALGDLAVRIEHVGSTSVPGLAAKPVIDIQVSVNSITPRAPLVDPLVAIGYRHAIDPIETQHEFLSIGYHPDTSRKIHISTSARWGADGKHAISRSRLPAIA